MTALMKQVQLCRTEPDPTREVGEQAYEVVVNGRWVGWVGNGRDPDQDVATARRWWACWRQDGDPAVRWSTGCDLPTRKQAVAALLAHIDTSTTK